MGNLGGCIEGGSRGTHDLLEVAAGGILLALSMGTSVMQVEEILRHLRKIPKIPKIIMYVRFVLVRLDLLKPAP